MSHNILIVDDSAIIRRVVKRVIAMIGTEFGAIHEARDGLEALQVLGDQCIDLVFADLNMPRMGGVELIEKMAQDPLLKDTSVIVITADRNESRLAELRKARGVRAFLDKPFRPEELREVMTEVLRNDATGDNHG